MHIFLLTFYIVVCQSISVKKFLDIWNKVSREIECYDDISVHGDYSYKGTIQNTEEEMNSEKCKFTIIVPNDQTSQLIIGETICKRISSPNVTISCANVNSEVFLTSGEYAFFYNPMHSIEFTVIYSDIKTLDCNEFAKNLHSLIGVTISLTNTEGINLCPLRLPPSIRIEVLSFKTSRNRKCCADFMFISSDWNDRPVEVSESHSTCDMDHNRELTISETRCEGSWIYLRNAAPGDTLLLRIAPLQQSKMEECIRFPSMNVPKPYTCKRRKNRNRFKKQHLYSL